VSPIISAYKIVVRKTLGQDAVQEIENVPLSKSTVSRYTGELPHDAQEVLRYKLKNISFYIQVYDSPYSTNESYIVAFVRFANDGEIQEKFFCCRKLGETSIGQDIFNVLCLDI
jgi:hypothetical protein